MASVRALIVQQGKVLLLQRGKAISRPGQWCLPGGRIQPEEQPEEAVVRETQEEAGLVVRVLYPLQVVGSCHYFRCELTPPEQVICLHPEECQAFIWTQARKLTEVGAIMDYRILRQIFRELKL